MGGKQFFDAFPDAAYTLSDLFFAGDKGVWRGTWHATQRERRGRVVFQSDYDVCFGSKADKL